MEVKDLSKTGTIFLIICITLSFLFAGCSQKAEEVESKPNIVLIMADDLGHEVLGSYGGTSYSTPNLDKLAQSGMRFTHCYSAPKCSPSRVKIMTGRYAFRTTSEWGYIPPEEVTFGHMLDAAGYEVALAGKWQMTMLKDNPDHIRQMGFKESSVFGWHEGPRYYEPFIYENGQIRDNLSNSYGPDVFCQFLIDFIERNRNKQFFAYYPMSLAHEISNDLEIPPPTGPKGRYQSYKELVEYADILIGRIMETLDKHDLRENTLVLFTGDNGTPREHITEYKNGEYLDTPVFSRMGDSIIPGGKNLLTDAGTHVPLIASWKEVIPAETICEDLIDFSDFLPSLADLAGAELQEDIVIDGRSFAPQLLGLEGNPRRWVYQEHEGKAWIRNHKYKLYRDGRLFDVENDIYEYYPSFPDQDTGSVEKIREYFETILGQLK